MIGSAQLLDKQLYKKGKGSSGTAEARRSSIRRPRNTRKLAVAQRKSIREDAFSVAPAKPHSNCLSQCRENPTVHSILS